MTAKPQFSKKELGSRDGDEHISAKTRSSFSVNGGVRMKNVHRNTIVKDPILFLGVYHKIYTNVKVGFE